MDVIHPKWVAKGTIPVILGSKISFHIMNGGRRPNNPNIKNILFILFIRMIHVTNLRLHLHMQTYMCIY